MKKLLVLSTLLALTLASCTLSTTMQNSEIAIIPRPVTLEKGDGKGMTISSELNICYPKGDTVMEKAANFYAAQLGPMLPGCTIKCTDQEQKNSITIQRSDDVTHAEGYEIEVDDNKIEVKANDYSGAVYALQTIKQLMPNELWNSKLNNRSIDIIIPDLKIVDYPRFGYRGMHLDCARHFFTADSVKRYIDY
ncbi:MAG: glycoside hydrolase family 20 zincin-like fold domain-containing protein, partial [Mucinivorans sp.]